MLTFVYLLAYIGCMTGPGAKQNRESCVWADLNEDGPVDLKDVALWYNDAACVFETSTIRPARLIEEACP